MKEGHQAALSAAESLKVEGNLLFSRQKFGAAIDKYTEAITIKPDMPVLYVNRAMCHKKRNAMKEVAEDAEKALYLDKDNMKAHYLLGSSCTQQGHHARAITHLQKALEAAREKNDSIKDEIWHLLARAKFAHWQEQAGERAAARKRMCVVVQALEAQGQPQQEEELPGQLPVSKGGADNIAEIRSSAAGLRQLLDQAGARDVVREVPSTFTCPLTMEVFRDPVITPAGHSYERTALLEHLTKVGLWDPVVRNVRVTEADLIPNLGLRSAVQMYLDEHPYAWGECL